MAEKSHIYNVRSFDQSEVQKIKSLVKDIKKHSWKNNSTIMVNALEAYKNSFQGDV